MKLNKYSKAAFACGMALVGAAAISPAKAEGMYVSGFGGGGFLPDADMGAGAEASFDFGYIAGGAIGYATSGGARVELEGSYAANDVDSITVPGTPTTASGDLAVTAIMFNAIYEFSTDSKITPYIGLGLGAANYSYQATITSGASTVVVDDDEWVGASQALLGVGYDISDQVNISLGYRFFVPWSKPQFDATLLPATPLTTDLDHSSHSAVMTLRFEFE